MKINKLWMTLLATVALAACNSGSGNNSQSQTLDATHTALTGTLASNSVKDYVNQLAAVKVSNGDQRVEQLRQQLISYYSKAPVVQTVQAKGYTVDCIPFASQPGLINASVADKATAIALNNKHLAAMAKAGNGINKIAAGFDFKVTMCPESTVAIARVDPNHLAQMIKKAPPSLTQNKLINTNSEKMIDFRQMKSDNLRGGVDGDYDYSYITLALSGGYGGSPAVFTSFVSPDPKLSNNYVAVGDGGHSINQLWWTSMGTTECTLETGWVVSPVYSYPSSTIQTELFTFSTTDGYEGNSSDYYNQGGGFVQYSDTPATIGTPLASSQQFTLSFTKLADNSGYELRYNSNGNTQAMGYYQMSRFPSDVNFNQFIYGSEVATGTHEPLSMGGTITNAGTMDISGNMITQESPSHTKEPTFGYAYGFYQYSYNFNSDGSITFSGTHGTSPIPTPSPTPSPVPTSQPSGAPFGQYTQGASAINWDGSHLSAVYNGVTTPVLNYADTCASGASVSVANGILSCTNYTPGFQQLSTTENYSHGYWPNSCYVQDVSVDTSLSGCSGTTPQTAGASCVNQVQAYCQNGSGSYVQTTFNPNGSGCYDSTNQMWNIALNSNGQLYCPTSANH